MTPGKAMGVAGAVLRHNGFTIDECEAYPVGTGANLKGSVTTLDGLGAGRFTGTVREDGTYILEGGAFGRISEDGADPFIGL